jgi:hypothetical protein
VAAIAVALGCSEPTRGCDVCTWSAIIYGNVTKSDGSPASGVTVRVNVGGEPCNTGMPSFEGARTFASAAGFYRFQVLSPIPSPQCVRVEALLVGSQSLVSEAHSVVFKLTADASLPYDSIRIDLAGSQP